jgi:hypothetical protein
LWHLDATVVAGTKFGYIFTLDEGFLGNWGINKNRHMLFGQWFIWVTDCHAIQFIVSDNRNNPAILQLQIHLMCWDITNIHRNDSHLIDADIWSQIGADICFNPLFKSYLNFN